MMKQVFVSQYLIMSLFCLGILFGSACSVPFNAERQYIATIINHAQRTINVLNELNDTISQPKMGDAAWERKMDAEVTTLRGLIAESRQIQPPPRFTSFHPAYMDVINALDHMVSTYDQAMAIRNNQQLKQAEQLLNQARQRVQDIQQKIEQLSSQTQ